MTQLYEISTHRIFPVSRDYIADHYVTHWGRVTHICVGNLTIIGSDNGLSPGRRQAITWTNVGILLIGPLGTNFSEMLIEIHTFSFKKIHLKMSCGKWRPSCLGLNMLRFCCALIGRYSLLSKYIQQLTNHVGRSNSRSAQYTSFFVYIISSLCLISIRVIPLTSV